MNKEIIKLEEIKCNDCDIVFYLNIENRFSQEEIHCPICNGETHNPRNLDIKVIKQEAF